jgi:hypothetical protein
MIMESAYFGDAPTPQTTAAVYDRKQHRGLRPQTTTAADVSTAVV